MTILQEPIKAAIWHAVNHYAYNDAIFLAERLFAEVGSNEALFLLATAYYRLGKPKVAQLLLDKHGVTSPECKLLYAQTAWDLEEYAKIERILSSDLGLPGSNAKGVNQTKGQSYMSTISEIQSEFGESACFALGLLGRVYLRTERHDRAELCLMASLKFNPFLWMSFELLCQAGKKPDPDEVFNVNNLHSFSGCRSHIPSVSPINGSNHQHLQQPHTILRRKSISKDLELENSAPDAAMMLRLTRHTQNRSYLTETTQQHSAPVPMSVTPSSAFSMKSGFPTPMGQKSQTPVTSAKSVLLNVNSEHLVTPPPSRVDFAGIISTSGSLKPLPSSAASQRDTTIGSPGSEFLRSTPAGDHRSDWDSSIDSFSCIASSAMRRSTRTQQLIGRSLIGGPTSMSPLTPSFGVLPLAETPSPATERALSMVTPADTALQGDIMAPTKKMMTRQSRKPHSADLGLNQGPGKLNFSSENSHRLTQSNANTTNMSQLSTPSNQQMAPVRRSTRIFANAANTIKENTKTGRSKFHQPKSALKRNARSRQANTKSVRDLSEEISKADAQSCEKQLHSNAVANSQSHALMLATQKSAVEGLMSLLRDMAYAFSALCQYDCREAICSFNNLPHHHRNTGWVLSSLGRAHFELTEYNEAANIFKELHLLAPHYFRGLEIYSTTLWHLKREVELSALAHDMKNLDQLCPETWCAVGNCFSLQRDHTSAASFFHRAVQLDSNCSYAYTLLGHELGLTDDLDGALTCYRNAVRCNPRHYNAWYGIGTIYYKQEKFKIAELHFRKALAIHPHSSVLLCHIGIAQHALKQTTLALRTLNAAVEMEPRNPLCKFHRATVLFAAERYQDALEELLELMQIVPKESLVYFLLGKVYKKLRKNHLAVISFSWAMELDPKGANNQIKEAIDKQNLPDDDEQSEEETGEGSILDSSLLDTDNNTVERQDGGLFQESDIQQDFQDRRRQHDSSGDLLHHDSDESL